MMKQFRGQLRKLICKGKKNFKKNKKIKILILGIAFKGLPETIDLRNAPALEIYDKLKKNNLISYMI